MRPCLLRSTQLAAALASVVLLVSCSAMNLLGCPTGLKRAGTAELFFGRNITGVEGVTDAAWQNFLDQEVTPRFPDGLSVFDADGQWRSPNGGITRERSKALLIVLPTEDGAREKIEAIRLAYKVKFYQDSVLVIYSNSCVGF